MFRKILLFCAFPVACGQVFELAEGRFVAKNDVSQWAYLARDVADMKESSSVDEVREIYQNGKHATYVDESGNPQVRSLSSLSIDTFEEMKSDPMYSFFRHAFLELGSVVEGEDLGQFDDRPVAEYADTLVLDLLALNKTAIAAEATVVLNVWMYICHQLYEILRACKDNDSTSVSRMEQALDIAAALWIGADQRQGDNDSGNLLYNLAEKAGERFDQDQGETRTNVLLLDEFNTLELGISIGTCATDADGYIEFRSVVRKIIGHMTVPLVQTLIHHIQDEASTEESDYIELYALSIGPRVEACKPGAYKDMLELFVQNNFQDESRGRGVQLTQGVFDCLEVSCSMVGSYRSGAVPACSDDVNPELISFAGYPLTFDATPASRLDRDILQIRVLTRASAFQSALDYYQFGYNSKDGEVFHSLQRMAQSPFRSRVTSQFDTFSGFFQNANYADKIITDALSQQGTFAAASTAQLEQIVTGALTYMVMYMGVLERLYSAIEACRGGTKESTNGSVLMMDEAVAFYVGSIENSESSGGDNGEFLYGVADRMCRVFGTCASGGESLANQRIIQAFKDASDALTQGLCDQVLDKVTNDVEPLLVVPLIQGTMSLAALTSDLEAGSSDYALGASYAFAWSILPLIASADVPSGKVLSTNMNFQLTSKPVQDGLDAVLGAVKTGVQKLQTPSVLSKCDSLGALDSTGSNGNICDGAVVTPLTPQPASQTNPLPTPVPVSVVPPRVPIQLVTQPPVQPTPAPQPVSVASPVVLGFGRYNFETTVDPIANIALDIRDMLLAPSVDAANKTYIEGGNARSTGGDGTTVVSLADISRTAGKYMAQDPMFNIFRWALFDEKVFTEDASDTEADSAYADVVVQKAFVVTGDIGLAAETAVAMHVWMEITHHVFDSVRDCADGLLSAVGSIDRAIALWIGQDQQEADESSGYLMYHIAEEVARDLGISNGEAPANTDLILLFNQAQRVAKQCEQSPDKSVELKVLGVEIYRKMTIPLIQKMLHHINQGQENYIELYALAVVPQAISCGETLFEDLRDALITEQDFNPSYIDEKFFEDMRTFGKCLKITCDDLYGDSTASDDQLRTLISNSCYDDKLDPYVRTIAGFKTDNDVSEVARLDRDILLIGILIETSAFSTAEDIYVNGYNSLSGTGLISLRDLATSLNRVVVTDQFQIFENYYGSPNYGDDLVLKVLKGEGEYGGASKDQRAEIVTRALQTMVLYMSILEALYGAVDACENSGGGGAAQWEQAVALFIGSLEGSKRGGVEPGDGTALYALGKELCTHFGSCEESGDAAVNEFLLESFADGRDLIRGGYCDAAAEVVTKEIVTSLPIGMIEGTLFYTAQSANLTAGSDSFEIASGFAFSRSILPLIQNVNATSGATIRSNLEFDLTKQPVADGPDAIYEAITFALPGLNIDCDDVGVYQGRTVCAAALPDDNEEDDNPTPIYEDVRPVSVVDTPTNLGQGLYTTTTYVQDRANIALDIAAIKSALETGSNDLARIIYKSGENSDIYNSNGIKIGQRSIMNFSTTATLEMNQEPTFNIFKYGLQNGNNEFLSRDVRLYADTIVDELLRESTPNSGGLAADAMVALNIWMYLAHQLWETVENCKKTAIADEDGIHSIDEAVAYWIGDGQLAGDGDRGHLLYALAERMGEIFQIDVNGQSRTNTNILKLFNQAKIEISLPNACSESSATFVRLRSIVNRIISQMTIPLIQGLIHNLRSNNRNGVKMYAQAFAPLTSACEPDLFAYLRDKLMDLTYNVIEVEEIVGRIRGSYDCLGVTCDDIGQHIEETNNVCIDTPRTNPLAGYRPSTDVRQAALLDLDILEAAVLMETNAYNAVSDLYMYGKHATEDGVNGQETTSLHKMAVTSERTVVPSYDSFVRYYDDNRYADTIIRRGLDMTQLPAASDAQRKEMVVKTMQFMVVYMGALKSMYSAVSGCESTDPVKVIESSASWDTAAALMIGSIEGAEDGGGRNGQGLYGLAKKRCWQFDTCGDLGVSLANERLISLLYTGKGALEGGGCNALRRAVKEIEPLLLVPLVQSTLRYTLENERHSQFTQDADLADGYVFSRALLPLVEDVDRGAAETIDRNLDFQFERKPVIDGSMAVFSAFAAVYHDMGIDCTLVGSVNGVGVCVGAAAQQSGGGSGNKGGLIAGVVMGILAFCAAVVLVVISRKKKKRKMMEEERPIFRANANGELNHDSDILSARHNDAALTPGDEQFEHRLQTQADALAMA